MPPRVPTLDGPQVRQTGFPGARVVQDAPIEAFGGGSVVSGPAGAAQSLLTTVSKIAEEEKKKADQVAVLDADGELSAFETDLLYNPETGALNKKGKDAFGIPETVMSAYGKRVAEIEKRLTSNDQRLAFRRAAQGRQLDVDRMLQRHVSGEIQRYDSEKTESYVKNERDAALANPLDTERVGIALERTKAAISDHAARNGMPAEWVTEKTSAAESSIHYGIISGFLSRGEDLYARQYYEQTKDQLYGDDRKRAEVDVKAGSLKGQSKRIADEIAGKQGSLGSALAALKNDARLKDNAELYDATLDRVKQNFQLKDAAREEAVKQVGTSALNFIEKNKTLDNFPEHQWQLLPESTRRSLKNYLRDVREGIEPVTDWAIYNELQRSAGDPERRVKFAQMDLLQYRDKLENSRFVELVQLQSALRRGDEKVVQTLDGIRSKTSIIDDRLDAMGIGANPKKGTSKAVEAESFRMKVDEAIQERQRATGKKVTNDEVDDIVQKLSGKVVLERGRLWDTTARAYQIKPGQQAQDVDYSEIPELAKRQIMDSLKKRQVPATEENIKRVYLDKVNRGRY